MGNHDLAYRKRRRLNAATALQFLFFAGALCLLVVGADLDSLTTFSLIFSSIVLEALPFMLLGSLIGGFIETFVRRERLIEIIAGNKRTAVFVSAGMGLVLPVCECGIVPVVRRLIKKGMPVSAAVAFLLGVPLVNSIVALSTFLAYNSSYRIAGIRLLAGYMISVFTAFLLPAVFRNKKLLADSVLDIEDDEGDSCDCSCHSAHSEKKDISFMEKIEDSLKHAMDDFFLVAHYLVVGAFVAAAANTFIDRRLFASLSEMPLLSISLMMILAVALNLCSESDAFVAASFKNTVPVYSQMSFMLMGPMVDIKLLLMYRKLFVPKVIAALALLITVQVYIVSIVLHITGVVG